LVYNEFGAILNKSGHNLPLEVSSIISKQAINKAIRLPPSKIA
jgi:hypothetical protein